MYFQALLYRFRWLNVPAGILMLLLQRTPVLRVLVSSSPDYGLRSAEVLKSVFALAALGAYNSVAGATVFNSTVVSPTTVSPTSAAPKNTFTVNSDQGAAFSLAFSGSGAPGTIRSWKVTGSLPPGISVTGGTTSGSSYIFNGLKVTLAGTPTTAGTYPLTINAYSNTGASGDNTYINCSVVIAAAVQPTVFPSALTGKFEGLLVAPTGAALPIMKLAISVTSTGAFTGRLTTNAPSVVSISGQLSLDSSKTFATLPSLTAGGYTVRSLKVSSSTGLTAILRKGTSTATIAKLTDGIKLAKYSSSKAAPWKGAYTAAFAFAQNLDPATKNRAAPAGAGYATGTVSATGTLALKGKLADGRLWSGSFATDSTGGYRIFAQPYGTAGNSLAGWIKLTKWATTPSPRYRVAAADGQDFYWTKPAKAGDTNYVKGFGPLALQVQMATWLKPTSSSKLYSQLGLSTSAAARLKLNATGAGLTSAQRKALVAPTRLNANRTLTVTNATSAKLWTSLKLTTTTGLITGALKVQDTSTASRTARWQGVVLQLPPAESAKVLARGYFILPPKTGAASNALGGGVTLTSP